MKLYQIASIASAFAVCALAQLPRTPEQASTARPTGSIAVVTQTNRELNTRKLKLGDTVTVKVVQDLVLVGKVVIPRGAKLIGHVSDLTPFTKAGPPSRLALIFDRGELKRGGTFPVHGFIQAIGPVLFDPKLEAIMSSSPYSSAVSCHPLNGGLMSTGQTNSPTPVGTSHRNSPNGFEQRAKALDNAENQRESEGASQKALGSANHGVFGLPGLSLNNAEQVPIIVAAGQNIDLKEGTQIVLRLDDSLLQQ
jgi:hypothetical protein